MPETITTRGKPQAVPVALPLGFGLGFFLQLFTFTSRHGLLVELLGVPVGPDSTRHGLFSAQGLWHALPFLGPSVVAGITAIIFALRLRQRATPLAKFGLAFALGYLALGMFYDAIMWAFSGFSPDMGGRPLGAGW